MRYVYSLSILVFLFSSCSTTRINKSSDFANISSVNEFAGTYLNRCYPEKSFSYKSILSSFNLPDYADFVTVSSLNRNEIILTYHSDSIEKADTFKGNIKKNYCEIYFSNKRRIIPVIYSYFDVDRVRIGKTKDGKLLIRKFIKRSGNLLILSGGYSVETPYIFSDSTAYTDLKPIKKNSLWGYCDTNNKIQISPRYDFASIFEHDVARVKLNNKWGLINREGKEITAVKYDCIEPIDTLCQPFIYKAFKNEKQGFLNEEGDEIIPVIYDYISPRSACGDELGVIRLGNKLGYVIRDRVVVPAIYSDILGFVRQAYALMKRDGKYYMVDKAGYEYETKGIGAMRDIILNTKRKIQVEEQKIE